MKRTSEKAPILVTVIIVCTIVAVTAAGIFGVYEYAKHKEIIGYHADFKSFESDFEIIKNCLSFHRTNCLYSIIIKKDLDDFC